MTLFININHLFTSPYSSACILVLKSGVTADVTIKGITKSITFVAEVDKGSASANIVIDRTDFDVRYGSGSFFDNLGDKTIYDDFELVVSLKY